MKYRRLMGVIMVACITTIAISFMPPRAVRRIFPPMVTGITIFLIGAALIGTGMQCEPLHVSLFPHPPYFSHNSF